MNKLTLKTKVAALVAVVLWASAFVGIRAGLQGGYSPGGLALLRFAIASICMALICMRLPARSAISWGDKCFLILIGMLGLGIYNITLNYGELSVSSGIASFIIGLSPVITMMFAVMFLGEIFSLRAAIGMMVSVLGVGLIMISETHEIGSHVGVCFVLVAALVSGLYSVVQKPFLKKYHAIEVTAYIIWGATVFLSVYAPNLSHEISHASLSATLSVIYLGIFPAAIGYLAWSYALQEISATRVASFLYFIPVVATLLGWVWLGEVPVLLSLVGGVVALFGVWMVNQVHYRQKQTVVVSTPSPLVGEGGRQAG